MRLKIRLVTAVSCVALAYTLVGPGRMAQAQAGPPAAPKVSTFAPADDLARQAEYYVKELENSVADKNDYNDNQEKLVKDANTLAVIALALGLHDQPSKYQAQAGALIKAAQAAAATKAPDPTRNFRSIISPPLPRVHSWVDGRTHRE